MKTGKKLLAGVLLALAVGAAGCGGGSPGGGTAPKPEVKAPPAVTVKAGEVEMTVQPLAGYSIKTENVFFANGLCYAKGDFFIGDNDKKVLTAYKLSGAKVEVDKAMFKDGVYGELNTAKKEYPAAAGDGRIYFLCDGMKSTDGKEVKEAKNGRVFQVADGSTADKAFFYRNIGQLSSGKLAGGDAADIAPFAVNGVEISLLNKVVVDGDMIYIAGQTTETGNDTNHIAAAVSMGGDLVRRFGENKRTDPRFIHMVGDAIPLEKYVIVGNKADETLFVFKKADGAFIGKVKVEDMLGGKTDIVNLAKVDNKTLGIHYRTDTRDTDKKYTYGLATVAMK